MGAPNLAPIPVLARTLLNDLDEMDEKFILVLDDYHKIHEEGIHELLTDLLEHPSPAMHLALLVRRDPPLPLSRFRARGQVTEIGVDQLRFNTEETAEFLSKTLDVAVEHVIAAELEEKTEGWVTGLRLAALSLRSHEELKRVVGEMTVGYHYITEYLLQEVLAQQPPAMARYLTETSILDRFCAPLCDVLHEEEAAGETTGEEFIRWLEKTNLFVIPLDSDHTWFRYHHLFQDLLRNELRRRCAPAEIENSHLRASQWLGDQSLIEEAVKHALAAGDIQLAVQMVERNRYLPMNLEQWDRLERWLAFLPAEAVENNPILTSARAYLLEYRGEMAFIAQRDRAESLLAELPPDAPDSAVVRGEIAILKGEQAVLMGRVEPAIEFATRAAKLVPGDATHLQSFIVAILALAYQGKGDLARGLAVVDTASTSALAKNGTFRAKLLTWRCMAHMMEGTLEGVEHAALQCLELGTALNLAESRGFGRYFLGIGHYLRNELPEAERYLKELFEDRYTCRQQYIQQGACALALVHTQCGRLDAAAKVIQTLIEQMRATDNQQALGTLHAFEVDLALKLGRYEEARIKSSDANFAPFPPIWFFFVPQLTPIKLLLASGSATNLDQALQQLSELDECFRELHRNTIRISVLSLQALAHDALGDNARAMEKLREALSLGALGGNLRSFVDLGPRIAELLRKLPKGNDHSGYVKRILSAFDADDTVKPTVSQPLIEPLSHRELEILSLLAQRLHNKEIAEELFISLETVKSHLKNIYQKLAVSGRREAITRSSELGIIPRL